MLLSTWLLFWMAAGAQHVCHKALPGSVCGRCRLCITRIPMRVPNLVARPFARTLPCSSALPAVPNSAPLPQENQLILMITENSNMRNM